LLCSTSLTGTIGWSSAVTWDLTCTSDAQNFISDIRAAQNKEQEQRRVDKELAKIRERFGDDKSLSGEHRVAVKWHRDRTQQGFFMQS
jgi:hypothetical protein